MFTDCCLHCIALLSRKKLISGIKNINTFGFGGRGQVDLIDFQSMPDGDFWFLLNYNDHGIKKLTFIPLVAKRAASVALVLLMIFTLQGPPTTLQTGNGSKSPTVQVIMLVVKCFQMMSSWNLTLKRSIFFGKNVSWFGDLLVTPSPTVGLRGWIRRCKRSLVLGWRKITLHIGLLGARFVSGGTILKSTKLSKLHPITLAMVSIPALVFRICL